jgi:hypothetical protein
MSLLPLPILPAQKAFLLLCRWSHLAQTFLKALQRFMVGALPQKHLLIVQA